jgi:nitroreductase
VSETNPRVADYPVDRQYLDRWSPRAFTAEKISEAELRSLFEAARWAPSSFNLQPWRFFYGLRETPQFDTILGLLSGFNQDWAKHAAALVIVASKTTSLLPGGEKPVPTRSHSFDTGAAWGYFGLEAHRRGWATHAMGGFDVARTTPTLNLPEDYRPEAAVAVGRRGNPDTLPEGLRAREMPNGRNPQSEFVFEGGFTSA